MSDTDSTLVVTRPVWRRFVPRFRARAITHALGGGFSAVVPDEGRIELLLPCDGKGRITELGLWALLAIEQQRWRKLTSGPEAGLATALVGVDFEEVVLDMCERDGVHEGPTRTLLFDCLACGACCTEANVELEAADLARFRAAGRADLVGKDYVRRARGKVTLRFLENGRCQHLGGDNKCAVYSFRPDNCRAFPVGSECCLAAREQSLGWVDG